MGGYVFRARRMIRGMGHMLFPRYIQREARDFFYLTSRTILPGAPVAPPPGGEGAPPLASPGEGVWRTKGLPQHGFPYALATTWVRAPGPGGQGDLKVRIVRADPRTMRPASAAAAPGAIPEPAPTGDDTTVLSLVAPVAAGGAARAPRTLWWHDEMFAIAGNAPARAATALLGGCSTNDACAAMARAALGVEDEAGMLVWVELPPDAHPDASTARRWTGSSTVSGAPRAWRCRAGPRPFSEVPWTPPGTRGEARHDGRTPQRRRSRPRSTGARIRA